MAHAQKLAEQVKSMSARIQELEEALQQTQAGDAVHPLLTRADEEPLWDPTLEDVSEAIGSLFIGADGQAKYHGGSAGSEVRHILPTEAMLMRMPFLTVPSRSPFR